MAIACENAVKDLCVFDVNHTPLNKTKQKKNTHTAAAVAENNLTQNRFRICANSFESENRNCSSLLPIWWTLFLLFHIVGSKKKMIFFVCVKSNQCANWKLKRRNEKKHKQLNRKNQTCYLWLWFFKNLFYFFFFFFYFVDHFTSYTALIKSIQDWIIEGKNCKNKQPVWKWIK